MINVKILIMVTMLIAALVVLPIVLMAETKAELQVQIDELKAQIQEIQDKDVPDVDLYIADLQEQIDTFIARHETSETTIMPTMAPSPTPTPEPERKYLGEFTAVAYYKGGNGLLTATGVQCKEGVTVAVDPKVIPYGTKIYIEGVGERIAEDCGGFRGNVIDIYFKTKAECIEFGKKKLGVWIVK